MAHELRLSLNYLKTLIEERKDEESKQYINKFFYRSGINMFFFDGDNFILYENDRALKLIPDELTRWSVQNKKSVIEFSAQKYLNSIEFKEKDYSPTIDFNKKEKIIKKTRSINGIELIDHYVNMAKPLPFDNSKKIKREKYENQLNLIYSHIKDVLCSGNDDQYQYVLNFIACTFKGRKLRKALYWQSNERVGKGTIIILMMKVLGSRAHKCSQIEEILKYNKNFEGRCFINIDEPPIDTGNYRSIGDVMKGYITEKTFGCRDMFNKAYQQDNTFNMILTTNNDAINLTQTNNERYVVTDISEHKKGDFKYFDYISKIIDTEEIQILFYRDMMNRYEDEKLKKWNEDITPQTESKKKKIIEALPHFHKWIKDSYILTGKNLNINSTEFYKIYYEETKDRASKQKLAKYINEIGIELRRVSEKGERHYRYVMSNEDLLNSFKNKNWIDSDTDHINIKEDPHDFIKKGVKEYDEIEQLKFQIFNLQSKIIEIERNALEKQKEIKPKKMFKKITTKGQKINEEARCFKEEIAKLKENKKPLQKKRIIKRKIFIEDDKTINKNELILTNIILDI